MEVSTVSAIAGRPGRSYMKRLTNSPAQCWASAALPPLPQSISLRPPVRAATQSRTASLTAACKGASASIASRTRRLRVMAARISVGLAM